MTTNTETKTHTITLYLLITENMNQFGYREIEPFFEKPYIIEDTDDCQVYEAEVPEEYILGRDKPGALRLWDSSHDMAYITASVNRNMTKLTLLPLYEHGESGTLSHYPIEFVRAQH